MNVVRFKIRELRKDLLGSGFTDIYMAYGAWDLDKLSDQAVFQARPFCGANPWIG